MSEDRPFLVWIGRIEQEDFLKKTKTLRGQFGEFPCSNSSSLLSTQPPTVCSHWAVEGIEPKSEALGKESEHLGGGLR